MLTLPKTATTYADKAAYCYRAIERLRLWHNEVGAKVDVKDAAALKAFREWVRTEWEPRNKAACLTLHSLPGFTQQAPADYMVALQKQSAKVALTPAETAAVATMSARLAAKTDGKAATSWDKDIAPENSPRLNVLGEPPDPLEDYTTYTEVDPHGKITVDSATQITVSGIERTTTAYVVRDKGSNHFAANFTHLIDGKSTTGQTSSIGVFWALTNALNDIASINAAYGPALWAYYYDTGYMIYLQEQLSGSGFYDGSVSISTNTQYYHRVVRDEAVGTYGTLYLYIYSNSGRTTLVDTLSVALHAKTDFQYVFPVQSYRSGPDVTHSFIGNNLDLGEQSVVPMLFNQLSMQGGN